MSPAICTCHLALASLALMAAATNSSAGAADDPLLSVRLAVERDRYLVGEPVDLHVIVRNVSDDAIVSTPVLVRDVAPQIPVFISGDGDTYSQYRIGLYETALVSFGYSDILAPDEERAYPLRVLYTYKRPSRLALEDSGTYFLKVRYRVQISKPSPQIAEVESNTVRIEVRKPTGFDAQLWEDVLNTKQFIQFLHSGQVAPGFPEVLDKAIDIVRRFPGTRRYHGALRNALHEYYRFHEKNYEWEKSPRTREELRDLLQINDTLFPDDKRLDALIVYDFREPTLLREFLGELSGTFDVPLSLAPETREVRFRGAVQRHSLREFMESRDTYRIVWARRGDGYELTTVDKAYALRLREAEASRETEGKTRRPTTP